MKLHVISDIHLETLRQREQEKFIVQLESKQNSDNADVLVVAGDLCCFRPDREAILVEALKTFRDMYNHVVYVPGNHEYWGSHVHIPEQIKAIKKVTKTHIMTAGQSVDIDGVRFAGGTLWYPRTVMPGRFIDFHKILDVSPEPIFEQHEAFLASSALDSDVCVTHHYPTEESIAEEWRDYRNNEFFCAKIEKHLEAAPKLPKLFIHGHTHNPFDFQSKYGFRVYCNPHGYENEGNNPAFWDRILIDI